MKKVLSLSVAAVMLNLTILSVINSYGQASKKKEAWFCYYKTVVCPNGGFMYACIIDGELEACGPCGSVISPCPDL